MQDLGYKSRSTLKKILVRDVLYGDDDCSEDSDYRSKN